VERAVISIERIDELKTEVGEDDFEEIVALFMSESRTIIGRLQAATDPAEAEDLLHALKGSALNLGFDMLASLCAEGQGAEVGSAVWNARLERLLDVFDESKARLHSLG
jgi:HPt (histidine-containing phosphotransfer) domain-containing protein